MQKLIFPQSGIFHLQKLANALHEETGIRHRLSDELSMMSLIKDCARSEQAHIQEHFAAFTQAAGDDVVDSLAELGIIENACH